MKGVMKAAVKAERKIIVYIATSADGYIARADGGVDWLNRPRPVDNYEMGAFYKSIDTILWGRKTYELTLGFGGGSGSGGKSGGKIKSYVFSSGSTLPAAAGVEFVSEPIAEFAKRLRTTPGKHIWMMGGGGLIASFLDAGEIDEFIIHVIPTFIGEGIPLIAPRSRTVHLELLSTKTWSDGVVRLHYTVAPQVAAKGSASKTEPKAGRAK
jgi:dihydrofolate reductase